MICLYQTAPFQDYLDSTVDTDGLVLWHQDISNNSVDYAPMCFQLFMVYTMSSFFHLGAIIGMLVDAVLPIRPTFLQYWIGCGAVLGMGFSMFGMMQVMGMNPMWTVSLALKRCAQKSWIHLDTTPFSALVKDGAALFGRLGFTQGSTIYFCLMDNHWIHVAFLLTDWPLGDFFK